MSDKLQEIEAKGRDVETAIEVGLAELDAERADVIVEIIDEGSRGLLGIGSREAVVRLKRILPASSPKAAVVPPPVKPEPKVEVVEKVVSPSPPPPVTATSSPVETEEATQKEVAVEIVETLLAKMQIEATVGTALSEPDDLTGEQIDIIEISGDDLGVLIGPRGDTLNTVQYLVRLMVSHRLHQRVNFVIDVQGYRQRRQQALASLANRMAKKVIQRGRPIGLEPMPPHERRVIHMTLREHDEVYTESSGEGNRRKVRIIPK